MAEVNIMYELFISWICIAIFIFCIFKFDILEPSLIIVLTTGISIFFAVISIERWNLSVGMKTWFCLIGALLSFVLSSYWCFKTIFKNKKCKINDIKKIYIVDNFKLILSIILMLILVYFSVKEVYELSLALGNTNGYSNMIKVVRPVIESNTVSFSRWMSYRQLIAQVISYCYIFIFIFNVIYDKFSIFYLKFLIPLIIYIPFLILTTGRMSLLTLVIYIAVLSILLYQKKKGYSMKSKMKSIGILIVAGICFISLFLIFGNFTGKVITDERTPLVILSHYAGLSIPALDVGLNEVFVENGYIGSTTLNGIYRSLNSIGFDGVSVQLFLPFVKFDGIDTNVYTAEYRYVKDFGYIGMFAIMWILGAIYTILYNIVKFISNNEFLYIIYSSIIYPLFLTSIDERIFLDLIGTSIVYLLFSMFIGYKLIICNSRYIIK